MQKQPFTDVLQNWCSLNFRNIHMKTPVLEFLFNKDIRLHALKFIKKRLQHRCFPVNISKNFKNSFFIIHLWWLLLVKRYREIIFPLVEVVLRKLFTLLKEKIEREELKIEFLTLLSSKLVDILFISVQQIFFLLQFKQC